MPSFRDLPSPGMEAEFLMSPALRVGFSPLTPPGKPHNCFTILCLFLLFNSVNQPYDTLYPLPLDELFF